MGPADAVTGDRFGSVVTARQLLRGVVGRVGSYGQAGLWPVVGHLAVVSLAGSLRVAAKGRHAPEHRFRVVIPARDEEAQISAAVESALGSAYPSALRGVVVLADNCADGTASVARTYGAKVWERSDPARPSKGAALEWGLARLLQSADWDAVVILDADSRLHPDFLAVMNSRLVDGARVVQGEREVVNAASTAVAWLSQMSSAAQWVLRPRGRARVGAAAKLFGSGMVIHREVLERCPWQVEGLAEDVEYWLALLRLGIHPVHEPAAVVSDVAPTDLTAARVQRSRWEAGKVSALHEHGVDLARVVIRRRDPILAEAVLSELVFPNLSVTGALIGTAGGLRWMARRQGMRVSLIQSGIVFGHLGLALRAAGAPRRAYAALAFSPLVALWRLWVTVEATLRHRRLQWRGTPRASAVAGSAAPLGHRPGRGTP